MKLCHVLLLAASLFLLLAVTPSGLAQPAPKPEKVKKEALEWLTSFARFQVLFSAEDVAKLRQRIEAMTPEEAAAWWEKTAPQRAILASPQWMETESWLRKFLNVQARYSDEEIRAFQANAAGKAKESAPSLAEVLNRVTEARRRLSTASQQAEQTRQLAIDSSRAFQKDEVRRREQARQQANAAPAATFPTPTVRQYATPNHAPLIDSLDVARWAVLEQIFPAW
jgi:hypothetical protein